MTSRGSETLRAMHEYEKLGAFYLGRVQTPKGEATPEWMLLDSRSLLTHGVILGMTGSGKTGLGIALLEEAAIDGIPALVLDPKGDLGNLLLTFPELRPADFLPWMDREKAARPGLSTEALAEETARSWRQGLADWGQDPERIRRLREAAEVVVYTPGSTAGRPVSVLASLSAPAEAVRQDPENLGDRVQATVSGILGLLEVPADPLKSREHLLLSALFQKVWSQGRDLTLEELIHLVQNPGLPRIGVLELESFYPAGDRFELAMRLNSLVASPSFQVWLQGEPLDPARLLYTPEGRPRLAIFSTAHLTDPERIFFTTMLAQAALTWIRGLPGTSSLRALFYLDEIFGFLPPVANPPSKRPLLTLLKQARAFGLGLVLATQNPGDLDYKALANAGTWFVGCLQTDRDRMKVSEGLAQALGSAVDPKGLQEALGSLQHRSFLLLTPGQVPTFFKTRQTMSYLCGPMTREDLRRAQEPSPPTTAKPTAPARALQTPPLVGEATETEGKAATEVSSGRPVLPPEIHQAWLPANPSAQTWKPVFLGVGRVHVEDRKLGTRADRELLVLVPVSSGPLPMDWSSALESGLDPARLESAPSVDLPCEALAPSLADARSYARWGKEFADWLYRTQKLELYRSPSLGLVSAPGESEGEFRARLAQTWRERRDEQIAALQARYAPRMEKLKARLERAAEAAAKKEAALSQQRVNTAVSFGSTLMGALFGRKALSVSNVQRAGSTWKSASRVREEERQVERAQEKLADLQEEGHSLEAQFQAEVQALQERVDPVREPLETVELRPRRTDVAVRLLGLGWAPVGPTGKPAWRV